MQETYRFNKSDYGPGAFNKHDGKLFVDFVKECERDFHERYKPHYANMFYANGATMNLVDRSFILENESFGMDGEFDFDTNLKIDDEAKIKTIFAIASVDNDDLPMFMIQDNKMSDGLLTLKYEPDDDDDDDNGDDDNIIEPDDPVENITEEQSKAKVLV